MKLLKENQTEEYEDHAWEVGDVGVRLTCVAKVSYVKFSYVKFIISGSLSYTNEL